jgi:UDP-4-amino-4,6-dideoxy-N-acetyl-beta-L-altrosamine transaminase
MIPYGRQEITQADIDAIVNVLHSDYLTQGPVVPKFEQSIASHCGAKHAVAVNSATSALHIACLALNLQPNDWLWTSPTTFVASANCGLYCGAQIDFVDIDPSTYNMSVERLAEKLEDAKKQGKLPKILIPVHLCGQACDMYAIQLLSQKYGFKIIEDASHAIGGQYQNLPIGDCRFSDITIFSFHPVKIITTGEGGIALTNNVALANRMQRLRSHGISSNSAEMHVRPDDEIWNYQQIYLGFNYRMTDIQAALGISQMSRLNEYIKTRHQLAYRYDAELSKLPIQLPWQHPETYSSYHLYPIRINKNKCGKTQKQIYDALQAAQINVNLHYIPVYRQPYYESMGYRKGYCPEAEQYYKETLSIPIYPALSTADQTKVIHTLQESLA